MARQSARWLLRCVGRRRVPGLAAEVSFWLFLSLLPIAAVGGMIAAKLTVGSGAAFGSRLAAMAPSARHLVRDELEHVAEWRGGAVGPIGAVVFLWLASSGVQGLFEGFDLMRGHPRSWARTRGLALGACLLLSVVGAAVALLSGGVEWLRSLALGSAAPVAAIAGVAQVAYRALGSGVLAFLTVAGLYALGTPVRGRGALPILPGALFATLLQATLILAYSALIGALGDGSAYLAGLAAVGVAMTFVYLNALSILLGVAVNQWWRVARRLRRATRGRSARAATARVPTRFMRAVHLDGAGSLAARASAETPPRLAARRWDRGA